MIRVIGESLVDIIGGPRQGTRTQDHPGGSPLNVAVGVSRLGPATTLVTHYANDPYGHMIEEHLNANGVAAIRGGSAHTSRATATLGPDGAATYAFDISWDINGASLAALAAVQGSTHVHTGSIAAVVAPGGTAVLALLEAARAGATISFDPNCRPEISPDADAARTTAERFVAASDIVKASDEDLAWLYPHRTAEESLAAWLELGPALAALTRGASGPVAPQRSPAPGRGQTRRTQPNSARSLFGCRPGQGINESGRRREVPAVVRLPQSRWTTGGSRRHHCRTW